MITALRSCLVRRIWFFREQTPKNIHTQRQCKWKCKVKCKCTNRQIINRTNPPSVEDWLESVHGWTDEQTLNWWCAKRMNHIERFLCVCVCGTEKDRIRQKWNKILVQRKNRLSDMEMACGATKKSIALCMLDPVNNIEMSVQSHINGGSEVHTTSTHHKTINVFMPCLSCA